MSAANWGFGGGGGGQNIFFRGRNVHQATYRLLSGPILKFMQSTVNYSGNIEDMQLQFSALRQLLLFMQLHLPYLSWDSFSTLLQLSLFSLRYYRYKYRAI